MTICNYFAGFRPVPYLLIAVLACLTSTAVARETTDKIWLSNGDHLTGEIIQLVRGMLTLSTDFMGTINIEWNEIIGLESNQLFIVERTDGQRISGTIEEGRDSASMLMRTDVQSVEFAHNRVVRIDQLEADERLIERLRGSLSVGMSYTSASDIGQANFTGEVASRTETREISFYSSAIITEEADQESTQRTVATLSTRQFRDNRWFNQFFSSLESNDQLGLNYRLSLGAGIGRYFMQTNNTEFSFVTGLVGTEEDFDGLDVSGDEDTPTDDTRTNAEALFGLDYSHYIYSEPVIDLSATVATFANLTEAGRYRTQMDLKLRWEVIEDLFWDLSYYNTFDSDPSEASDATRDQGIVMSLGWSF